MRAAGDKPRGRRHTQPVNHALHRINAHFVGRLVTTLVLLGATFIPYWWINDHTPPRFDYLTRLDTAIPFLPWTLPIYQSFFVLIIAAAWVCEAPEFLRLLGAVLLANVIAYVGFLTLTAHYPRPDWHPIEPPWLREAFRSMFSQDAPGNTFPSLHVAVTTLLTLRLRRRRFDVLWLVWGALVVLSTLTVKQHFILDVVGGLALALGLNAWRLRAPPPPAAAAPAHAKTE